MWDKIYPLTWPLTSNIRSDPFPADTKPSLYVAIINKGERTVICKLPNNGDNSRDILEDISFIAGDEEATLLYGTIDPNSTFFDILAMKDINSEMALPVATSDALPDYFTLLNEYIWKNDSWCQK